MEQEKEVEGRGRGKLGVASVLVLSDLSLPPRSRGLRELLGERHLRGPWRYDLRASESHPYPKKYQ